MSDEDESLEKVGADKEPELEKITQEITTANTDSNAFLMRVAQSRAWWQCEWPGITPDGRSWSKFTNKPAFPWEGCSDSRPRTVETIINEHEMICSSAFWSAKVQSKSAPGRQFAHAKESNITQKMLNWCVYTQMKRELINELPLAFLWKFGYGLSFLAIEWEQQRQLDHIPISLDMLSALTQQLGLPDVVADILAGDRGNDGDLIKMLQALSPILDGVEARKILTELRNTGMSQIPIANLRVNKPKWTALRPFIDLWFPSETCDLQSARWVARRELVNETELEDRIVTDGYEPKFVEAALEHKGVFSGVSPLNSYELTAPGSDRDLIELFHFRARVLHHGVPCMYKTVFNMAVASDGLYACHRKDEYEHGQYPFVALKRKSPFKQLLSAMGIAEEAYTDEIDIKRQQDGLNDRTDIIHQPPMIVPPGKATSIANSYGPRSVMTSLRPDAINWPPLPPMDQTPVIVMTNVMMRLNRRYPTMNAEGVDPQIVMLYRQRLGNETLSELELAFEQTLQLGQQYWTEQDVQMVAGEYPWEYTQQQIQRQASVVATVDMSLIDPEVAKAKLGMLAELMPFKDAGGMVFNAAANIVDGDLADAMAEDQMSPTAMKKEKDDEYAAWGQIGGGIVPQKPMMANNQLRLQTIYQEILAQPQVQQRMGQDKMFAELAKDRIEFFQNQIQQYQVNPQIGRSLTTQPFTGNQQAPRLTNAQAA